MNKNLLLATDVYKFGHKMFYPEGTNKVYSYLQTRSDKQYKDVVFYGLQYYIKEYLSNPVTKENVDEFIETVQEILGPNAVDRKDYDKLVTLGYIPLEIKAVPEGSVIPVRNVLMTITNTHPDFAWLVGFTESLLLKVWNTSTVATNSHLIKSICKAYSEQTCDNDGHLPFQVHDFGYRGCSSEETAALSGSAHLLSFLGTDTVPAVKLVKQVYGVNKGEPVGLSVPATEHSVMCAYTQEKEIEAFETMIKKYPTGIVSIVSDTYNLWNVLTNFTETLKPQILARDGKVVFRPDSGNPVDIICGDKTAELGTPEHKGAVQLLWEKFGGTVNSKGYKVLNPKVGLIYGDGITTERMKTILDKLKNLGFASSNIVFGVGGLLLQNFNRDTLGFAIKATYCEIKGEPRNIVKDPITDPGKKSHKGFLALRKENEKYVTLDNLNEKESENTLLTTVFKNGKMIQEYSFSDIRKRLNENQ